MKLKSPVMSPPRKGPIPNQYSTIIITQHYPILPPILSKVTTGHRSFIDDTHFSNPTENEYNDYTYNPHTDNKYSMKN